MPVRATARRRQTEAGRGRGRRGRGKKHRVYEVCIVMPMEEFLIVYEVYK